MKKDQWPRSNERVHLCVEAAQFALELGEPAIHSFVRCRDAFGYHKRKLMLFVEAHSAFGLALHQATRIVRRS